MSHLILRQQIAFYPSRLFCPAEQSVSLFIASPRAIINYRANTTFTQIVVENLSIRWVVPVGISVKPGKALTLRLRIWIHFFFLCSSFQFSDLRPTDGTIYGLTERFHKCGMSPALGNVKNCVWPCSKTREIDRKRVFRG